MPRSFYRIVKTERPSAADFTPKATLSEEVLKRRPEIARLVTGISFFDDVELARKKALSFPMLGDYLAEIIVPDTSSLKFERTTTSRGHYTLWADPEQVLGLVVRVEPVRPARLSSS